jgi:hypothetical protein
MRVSTTFWVVSARSAATPRLGQFGIGAKKSGGAKTARCRNVAVHGGTDRFSEEAPVSVTFDYMIPSDYAVAELALWEQALREQRDAEIKLAAARRAKRGKELYKLLNQVEALRNRADLLVAQAVEVKRSFRLHDAGNTEPA